MSNTKFTTGPWKAVIHNHKEHEVTNDSGQMSVAKVYIYDAEEQTLANAKLIASAPELLEACELMLSAFANAPASWLPTKDVQDAELLMNEAIRKATG